MKFLSLNLFLILYAHSGMKNETKLLLTNKEINYMTFLEKLQSSYKVKDLYYNKNDSIEYDSKKIREIINKNNFPETYNFFEDTKVQKIVKNQGSCGSCWSFASTTSLSYRFNKLGYDLNLSPQEPLSCFIKSCNEGSTAVNAYFNLVKNGTVTEECFPYSTEDGTEIEDCIETCKDGSEYKKYYAKNCFSTINDLSKDNYYDIVSIIMKQLVNYGPLMSSIKVYNDFYKINFERDCSNFIYSNNDNSQDYSGHALVIVGYGYEQSKYYWLAQNSWGETFCDGGLLKVEFGQIGIERVAFFDPYIPSENSTIEEISIQLNIDDECKLEYITTSSEESLKSNFEILAKSTDNGDTLYYQCGLVSLNEDSNKVCSLNKNYDDFYNKRKGEYEIKKVETIGNENQYNLEKSISFYYYGIDLIYPYFDNISFYVSESGSKILFRYINGIDDDRFLSKIYPNKNSNSYLKNCKIQELYENILNDKYIIYCNINSNEVDYFNNSANIIDDSYLEYDVLCGSRETIEAIVYKLDKTKYPLFRIKQFVLNDKEYITGPFKLIANIEGSVTGYKTENSTFIVLANIYNNEKNQIFYGICRIPKPEKVVNNYEINCNFVLNNNKSIRYKNVELFPYYYPNPTVNKDPFEIIISNNMKPTIMEEKEEKEEKEIEEEKEEEQEEIAKIKKYTNSKFTRNSLIQLLLMLIIF